MLDPFPIPPPRFLANLTAPFAAQTSLSSLPLHIHEVLILATFYQLVQSYLSPWISTALFPTTYPSLSRRTRLNWDVHVVSFVQSTLVCSLALWVMYVDEERTAMEQFEIRIWGYTGALGLVQAFGMAYFVWDFWVSLWHVDIFGVGMLAHAVSAVTVFGLGFRPFINFYAPTFVLYELSSPFLNIHWFCDKLNLTGSTLQLINGILLLSTFFGCRLVWGTYSSLSTFTDIFRAVAASRGHVLVKRSRDHDFAITTRSSNATEEVMRFIGPGGQGKDVPVWLAASYLAANIVLNGLNWYWFGKMVSTLRKRFDPPLGTRGLPEKGRRSRKSSRVGKLPEGSFGEGDGVNRKADEDGVVVKKETEIWRGVDGDGKANLEVDQVEVRRRVPMEVEESEESDAFVP